MPGPGTYHVPSGFINRHCGVKYTNKKTTRRTKKPYVPGPATYDKE